jgi:hypothetical protein
VKAPTTLVFGDADAPGTAHAVDFIEQLGGGKKDAGWDGPCAPIAKLAILPGSIFRRSRFSLSTARPLLHSSSMW